MKLTEKGDYEEHPDLQTLPITLGIIGDCVKETQPGIEAAEAKVKFWALCENMVLRPGEILVSHTSLQLVSVLIGLEHGSV